MLKFSAANAKIHALAKIPALAKFLAGKRKVYSFDLISGHSCPFAEQCLSKAVIDENGKRKIEDGPKTEFRCFSASQEVQYTNVYNLRYGNFNSLRGMDRDSIVQLLTDALPLNLGICRIHVAGDHFNQAYFDAWLEVAQQNPDRLFYCYTKSLPYWVKRINEIPNNMIITASYGGRCDHLIKEHNLRSVKVIYHPNEANGLEIDHTDELAANPEKKHQDFCLLVHGTMPKGSKASEAIKRLKKEGVKFAYNR